MPKTDYFVKLCCVCSCVCIVEVVDGERLQFDCSVSYVDYFGHLTTHYNWVVVNESQRQPVQINTATKYSGVASVVASSPTVPRLQCSVYFNRSDDLSYSDVAANTPSYRGQCTTRVVDVLSRPRDVHVSRVATDHPGRRRLRCRATGRPAPTYEWHRVTSDDDDDDDDDDDGELLTSSDSLLLTVAGRHQVRCTALNVIRGVQHTASSDVVIVDVPPSLSIRHIHTITNSTVGWRLSYDPLITSVGSVNETGVYEGSATSRRQVISAYLVAGTCGVAAVVMFITVSTVVIVVVVRCSREKSPHIPALQIGASMNAATESTWAAQNTQERTGDDETFERSADDDSPRVAENGESLSSAQAAVYDEIAPSVVESVHPSAGTVSEQYNELVMSDTGVTPGGVDIYCPLQRYTNNPSTTTRRITIAIGSYDVQIVFNDDSGTAGTMPPSQQTHANPSAS